MKVILTQNQRKRLKEYYDFVDEILMKEVKQSTMTDQEYRRFFFIRQLLINVSHNGYDDNEVDFNLKLKVKDILNELEVLYKNHLKK